MPQFIFRLRPLNASSRPWCYTIRIRHLTYNVSVTQYMSLHNYRVHILQVRYNVYPIHKIIIILSDLHIRFERQFILDLGQTSKDFTNNWHFDWEWVVGTRWFWLVGLREPEAHKVRVGLTLGFFVDAISTGLLDNLKYMIFCIGPRVWVASIQCFIVLDVTQNTTHSNVPIRTPKHGMKALLLGPIIILGKPPQTC